ncbi:hypothetical protein PAESOLCIP111_01256 [Paenibacillus solanacearum]|uniref:FAD-dependent oxidoreductase n=1 Tax=Paenibacillus solanacearum TaxID=2048548 RepID=A0A916NNV3_9BACL|nr:FAD-dependent oxidoreductase [Paenibacillus solanacearum]CAG7610560.1 hypothetical protein PAESOLCIP111_01256 [Paenibacillus solanacearum]
MKLQKESYDVVVCGGGLAGFCAAVAAARQGARTCLIHNRPVFGGNSSSEIRVTPHGAAQFHAYARETGILSELLIEERAHNHERIRENGWTNSVWDMAMYDMAVRTPNLTFHLNTAVTQVLMGDERNIHAVHAVIAGAETTLEIQGRVFIDCTGDGVVADGAGCEWRFGTEGRDEFNEPHAPEQASTDTMGSSIHFKAKDMGRPVPFQAPEWAIKHVDPAYFYEQGRHFYDIVSGYWWIEIGVPWHTIYDNEEIRHELTRHALGIWDWIKNHDPKMKDKAAKMALDWIGQVPGKRESRRIMGQYVMTSNDVAARTVFYDEVAFGGWFIDLHTAGGLLAATAEPASAEGYSKTSEYAQKTYCGPYGIPLRMLVSKDVNNLMMAGRNVSATHAALGTVRVMSTTALMGQAVGIAGAISVQRDIPVNELHLYAAEIQQTLLREGCFLPNVQHDDNRDLARQAVATASSSALVYGAGPENTDTTFGFRKKEDQQKYKTMHEPLHHRRGQWIAIGADRIDAISVCLTNTSASDQVVKAYMVLVDHIWDYRTEPSQPLAATELQVPTGSRKRWIDWNVGLTWLTGLPKTGYIRLDLDANPAVEWHSANTVIPGLTSAYEMGNGKMRRYLSDGGTLSFRITPAQSCYAPSNAISGAARPHASTNLWRSDPNEPLGQWLQLEWNDTVSIREVIITFPGHLFREYHWYEPFYRDPQCTKAYSIQAWLDDEWKEIHREEHNYHRHRKHVLAQSVATKKLRIVIEATHGDPSAAIYEVRCYSERSACSALQSASIS